MSGTYHRVFELGGPRAVLRHRGPVVWPQFVAAPPEVDHRFDREHVAHLIRLKEEVVVWRVRTCICWVVGRRGDERPPAWQGQIRGSIGA